jgi:hypothetical protein
MSQIDQSTADQVAPTTDNGSGNGVAAVTIDQADFLAQDWEKRLAAINKLTEKAAEFPTATPAGEEALLGLMACIAVVDDDEKVRTAAFAAVKSTDPEIAEELEKIREGDLYLINEAIAGWTGRQDFPGAILALLAYINQRDDDFDTAEFKQPLQEFAKIAPDPYTAAAVTVTGILLANRNKKEKDHHYCSDWKHRQSATWAARHAAPDPALVSIILHAAKTDGDYDVREQALRTLGQFGPAENVTLHDLVHIATKDENDAVNKAAKEIINRYSRAAADNPAKAAELAASMLEDLKSSESELEKYVLITEVMQELGHQETNQRGVEFIWRRVVPETDSSPIYALFRAGLTLNGDALLDRTLSRSLDKTHVLQLGRALVDKHPDVLARNWATLQKKQETEALLALLTYVVAARDRSDDDYNDKADWETRRNAVIWLGSSESDIQKLDEGRHEAIYQDLKQRLEGDEESNPQFETDADVRTAINIVLLLFERTIEANAQQRLISKLRQKEPDVDSAISTLVAKEDWKALRDLINFWVEWIVLDDKYVGVAIAEVELRRSPMAVLPLVERLKHPLQKTDLSLEQERGKANRQRGSFLQRLTERPVDQEPPAVEEEAIPQDNVTALLNLFVPPDLLIPIRKLWQFSTLTEEERYQVHEWFAIQYGRHEALADDDKKQLSALPDRQAKSRRGLLTNEQLRYYLNIAVDITLKKREVALRQRITRLLATMSNPYYQQNGREISGNDREKHQTPIAAVRAELQRHVVNYYSVELRTEGDIEIRENMARTLANLADTEKGQNAIDALVFAVVGEERRQNRRQELLFDYYLEPSKRRSDEAAKILEDAVDQAKATLGTLRRLNQHLFYVGLAVFVAGFAVAVLSPDGPTKALGIFSGLGGLAGVLRHMVKDPLDRIQNAMGNLVQMEAAFTSFMWKLNLNQTFIQSRYVANGHLTQDEIQTTVDRVENTMRSTLALVETYTETSGPRIVTRLHKITPVAASIAGKGDEVTIHGQYLFGDDMDKKDGQGVIALNHVPVEADVVKWEIDKVQLRLRPEDIQVVGNGQVPDSILISLFVDGMETNALPLRLLHAASA